jgi:catechol 2,3-dioxygenase-like lactoylglutathione lyase family enzyme
MNGRIVAFAASTDLERAKPFYQDILGLDLVDDDGFALMFDANGTKLRLSKVDAVAPAAYTVLGWDVDDIGAEIRALRDRGVSFLTFPGMPQNELNIWTAPNGAQVAWFKDPDGNTLSLSQHA